MNFCDVKNNISFDYVYKLAFSKDNFGIPVFLDFDVGKYRKIDRFWNEYNIQNLNSHFQKLDFI